MYEKAIHYIRTNRMSDAEKEIKLLLSDNPNDPYTHCLMAECLVSTDRKEEALQYIETAIHLEPDNDGFIFMYSQVLFFNHKINPAKSKVMEAIKMNPNVAVYFGFLAEILLHQKENKEALKYANKGLELDPEEIRCINARSTALFKTDDKEAAFDNIEKSLNLDPENSYTHSNLGWKYLELHEINKSLEHFTIALKSDATNEHAKSGMVEALKARYFIYRIFLRYYFWITNLSSSAQWTFLVGFYILAQVFKSAAKNFPATRPILIPVLVLYSLFALSTWFISPVFNLLLRINPYGRYALNKREVMISNLVGICIATSLLSLFALLLTGNILFAMISIFAFTMMIPVSKMLTDIAKPAQTILFYLPIGMLIIGILSVLTYLSSHKEFNAFTGIYLLAFVGYQWYANYLISKYA